jgi:hypothetical protein
MCNAIAAGAIRGLKNKQFFLFNLQPILQPSYKLAPVHNRHSVAVAKDIKARPSLTMDCEDELADMLASFHTLMSRCRLGQWERAIDHRSDASGR